MEPSSGSPGRADGARKTYKKTWKKYFNQLSVCKHQLIKGKHTKQKWQKSIVNCVTMLLWIDRIVINKFLRYWIKFYCVQIHHFSYLILVLSIKLANISLLKIKLLDKDLCWILIKLIFICSFTTLCTLYELS